MDQILGSRPWPSDAGELHQYIVNAEMVIGIDSGPEHLAGATETPTVVIWTGNDPLTCFDPCLNVTHLVPSEAYLNLDYRELEWWDKHYEHIYYDNNLTEYLERLLNTSSLEFKE